MRKADDWLSAIGYRLSAIGYRQMRTILFLCVKNSGRSQVAEGLARALAPPGYRFFSAGSEPGVLNPLAVQVLKEKGIDISKHKAKGIDLIPLTEVNTIVTLCAEEVCPVVPGRVERLHWPLSDPKDLEAFRGVRDELSKRLPGLWHLTPDSPIADSR